MTKKITRKEISLSDKIYIYSSGIVSCSVCADKSLTRKEIENHVNLVNPTGVQSSWKISKDKKFHTG